MKYSIPVTRIGYSHHTFEVEADNEIQAGKIALAMAGDLEFSESSAEYELDNEPVNFFKVGDEVRFIEPESDDFQGTFTVTEIIDADLVYVTGEASEGEAPQNELTLIKRVEPQE